MVSKRVHGWASTPGNLNKNGHGSRKWQRSAEAKLPRKRAVRAVMRNIIKRLLPQMGVQARDGQLLEARERDLGTTVDGINFANK